MSVFKKQKIIDAHAHLYDHRQNRHDFLEHVDQMFEALIGDYSTFPRQYLLDDYLADETRMEVAGLVWHEFLSSDPVSEVTWAQRMAGNLRVPMAIVGLVDFLAPTWRQGSTPMPSARMLPEFVSIWDEMMHIPCAALRNVRIFSLIHAG